MLLLLLLRLSFFQICIDKYPCQQCIFRIHTNKQTKQALYIHISHPSSFHHRLTTRGCKRLTHVSYIPSSPPCSLTSYLLIPHQHKSNIPSTCCWLIHNKIKRQRETHKENKRDKERENYHHHHIHCTCWHSETTKNTITLYTLAAAYL